jgi:hypothetical protein
MEKQLKRVSEFGRFLPARSHTWCDSDTGSRRQVGNMPYLGIGSISSMIHIMTRLPHATRAVVVVAVLIAIWR